MVLGFGRFRGRVMVGYCQPSKRIREELAGLKANRRQIPFRGR